MHVLGTFGLSCQSVYVDLIDFSQDPAFHEYALGATQYPSLRRVTKTILSNCPTLPYNHITCVYIFIVYRYYITVYTINAVGEDINVILLTICLLLT